MSTPKFPIDTLTITDVKNEEVLTIALSQIVGSRRVPNHAPDAISRKVGERPEFKYYLLYSRGEIEINEMSYDNLQGRGWFGNKTLVDDSP